MNMRAAEAIVSSAPKPMKIFPISEVWSQVELSLLAAARTRRGAVLGRGHRQRVGVRRRVSLQRAIDVVELIGGDDLGVGGGLRVGRLVGSWPAGCVGPRRHRLGAVGRRIGGGQLRIGVGDRRRDRGWIVVGGVVGIVVGFLLSEDFARPCRICGARSVFQWCEPCLAICRAPCAPDFDLAAAVLSAPAPASDGPAKHTNSPAARINAERPLALIFIWQSPHLPAPGEKRPCGVSAAGQKKGIFGRHRAKTGQRRCAVRARIPPAARRDSIWESMLRVPAGPIDVMSLPATELVVAIPERARRSCAAKHRDHDFVIDASPA